MFKVISLKSIVAIVITLIVSCGVTLSLCEETNVTAQPKLAYTVVIDAGHGGVDGGCVGKRYGAIESELNLQYAKELEKLCKEFGFNVVMTRETQEGLYSPLATNKKKSEMQKREKIINESKADIVISVHMNSINIPSVKGAQAFYKKGNETAKILADNVTSSLSKEIGYVRSGASVGDYYVLNCNDKASILIECGYLSNAEEEYNLMQEKYKTNFCKAVLHGVINYLKI